MTHPVPRALRLALFFAVATYSSLQAIVAPVIPVIVGQFGSSPAEAAWLISGFLVTGAVIPPIAGRVGDLIGQRRTLVLLLVVFLAGAVLAVVADSMLALIVARMVQGLGAGFISLGLSISREAYPVEMIGRATGMVGATMAVAAGLGLALAGPITALWGFRAIFLLPLVMAVVAILLMIPQIRGERPRGRMPHGVNWWGGVFFVSGLSCALLSITFGDAAGWFSVQTIGAMVLGVALLAAWTLGERRARLPLIDVRLFAVRGIRRAAYSAFLLGAISFATFNLVPLSLADARLSLEVPDAVAGLLMLPISAGSLCAGLLSGRIAPAIGSRAMFLLSSALNIVVVTTALWTDGLLWMLVAVEFIHGAALGLAYASLPALIMQAAPADASGVAAGIYNTLRSVGGAIGAQVMFAIVAAGEGAPGPGVFVTILIFLIGLCGLSLVSGLALPRASGPREGDASS